MDKWRWLLLLGVILLALSESTVAGQEAGEWRDRQVTVLAEDGHRLLVTARQVQPGDRFIDPANDLWVVRKVDGDEAVARRVAKLSLRITGRERALLWPREARQAVAAAGKPAPADVVIYHTHSGEAYEPDDGTDYVDGKGGIYAVGASLAAALREEGLNAVQRPDNHNPYISAYGRSRRTALDALADSKPLAVFDVHRDAAPASEYQTVIDGRQASRVMIVVGQSNPAHEGNLAFAKLLKGKADELYPGLVRGIYLGRGDYNQDTFTRNLLLEFGTHLISREEAARGAALMAAAVGAALREAGVAGSSAARAEGVAAWRTIGWLLAAILLLGGGALVLISGGWRPALARLGDWRQQLWDPLKRR